MYYRLLTLGKNAHGFLCLVTTLMILVAGLWPFDLWPENKVTWLKDRNGVHFYGQGVIFRNPAVNNPQPPLFDSGPITLEIWLQPDSETYPYLPSILSVYDHKESEVLFFGPMEISPCGIHRGPKRQGGADIQRYWDKECSAKGPRVIYRHHC